MAHITVKQINLHSVAMPFVEPLRTSFGEEPFKTAIIIELQTDQGVTGWGETTTEIHPGYSSETMGTAQHVLREFLIPLLLGKSIHDATDVPDLIRSVRGHKMAKYAVEAAVWDALAKVNGMSLAESFAAHLPEGHASKGYATVGVSIGIKPTETATVEIVKKRVDEGYGRIKLKIQPGWDVQPARAVRAAYPDVLLMLDANSAYTLADAEHLKQLDEFNLLMLEQPLGHDDIFQHSKLQPQINSPICLDESIKSADDVRLALEIGACKIINLKPSRVGGYTESLEIYKVCFEHNTPLWIGGMLETGIGRAANIAFASLPGVTLPCDISATSRYFAQDISEPPFELAAHSRIAVPSGLGIGVDVKLDRIQEAEAAWRAQYPYSDTPAS